ncbi:MAG: hypothetical protein M3O15_04570, partial [Acidobacteriota bacterium]|nr:hypothetical protein [Acidobacteriota bacterium]
VREPGPRPRPPAPAGICAGSVVEGDGQGAGIATHCSTDIRPLHRGQVTYSRRPSVTRLIPPVVPHF